MTWRRVYKTSASVIRDVFPWQKRDVEIVTAEGLQRMPTGYKQVCWARIKYYVAHFPKFDDPRLIEDAFGQLLC